VGENREKGGKHRRVVDLFFLEGNKPREPVSGYHVWKKKGGGEKGKKKRRGRKEPK